MVRQMYLDHVNYNQEFAGDFWDVNAAERRIKK